MTVDIHEPWRVTRKTVQVKERALVAIRLEIQWGKEARSSSDHCLN